MNLSIKTLEKIAKVGIAVCVVSLLLIAVCYVVEYFGLGNVNNFPIYVLVVGVVMIIAGYALGCVKMIFKI